MDSTSCAHTGLPRFRQPDASERILQSILLNKNLICAIAVLFASTLSEQTLLFVMGQFQPQRPANGAITCLSGSLKVVLATKWVFTTKQSNDMRGNEPGMMHFAQE